MRTHQNLRTYLIASILLASVVLFSNCKKEEEGISKETLVVNQWIEGWMNFAYFWNKELPNLNSKLEPDSEEYFDKLLKKPDDKWSFITDDAEELLNYFDGIVKSMGYSIQLYYFDGIPDQVIAIVEFVYPNSPASEAGLERGVIFTRINGSIITKSNYQSLLSLDEMTITWASETKSGIVEQPSTIKISARTLETNPIVKSSVSEVNGSKIGYLLYTSFIEKYDPQLIQTFSEFKDVGIDELVLDLRYNGGGAVTSAQLLAGLIAPTTAVDEIFISEVWNNNLSEKYNSNINIEHYDENLNLSRIYVLTTGGTASASEMVIYGLQPHMEVIQIGAITYGKYYGSITLTDENKKHNWAIQPIVMRAENKTNSIDYNSGLLPNYEIFDKTYNAQLGDPEEHFFAAAISHITKGSFPPPSTLKSKHDRETVRDFKRWNEPHKTTMLVKKNK